MVNLPPLAQGGLSIGYDLDARKIIDNLFEGGANDSPGSYELRPIGHEGFSGMKVIITVIYPILFNYSLRVQNPGKN